MVEKPKNSTAIGTGDSKFHEELNQPSQSAAPEQRTPGKKSARGRHTARGPPTKTGRPRVEQIWLPRPDGDGKERCVTIQQWADENGVSLVQARRYTKQKENPLPFFVMGGQSFIRDGASRKFILNKERADTTNAQKKFEARQHLKNQQRIDLQRQEIEAKNARISDALNE